MSFQPSNFFIGLTDFFTMLLPGAVVSAVGGEDMGWPLVAGVHLMKQACESL